MLIPPHTPHSILCILHTQAQAPATARHQSSADKRTEKFRGSIPRAAAPAPVGHPRRSQPEPHLQRGQGGQQLGGGDHGAGGGARGRRADRPRQAVGGTLPWQEHSWRLQGVRVCGGGGGQQEGHLLQDHPD